jgi:hypothetical protein
MGSKSRQGGDFAGVELRITGRRQHRPDAIIAFQSPRLRLILQIRKGLSLVLMLQCGGF